MTRCWMVRRTSLPCLPLTVRLAPLPGAIKRFLARSNMSKGVVLTWGLIQC